jgi:hypothetical protein
MDKLDRSLFPPLTVSDFVAEWLRAEHLVRESRRIEHLLYIEKRKKKEAKRLAKAIAKRNARKRDA